MPKTGSLTEEQFNEKIKIGDEVTVHIKFRAIDRPIIDDAVLVDLLPGGFDLVLPNAPASEQPLLSGSVKRGSANNEGGEEADEGDGEGDSSPRGCVCLWLVNRPERFPDYADLREDRVVLYGQATDRVQEFSYRIKATNAGTFTVPASYGESMYNPLIRARSAPGHLVVQRP